MALISQRVRLAREIGNLKTEQKLPIRNFQVEKQVVERIRAFAREFDLNEEFSQNIFEDIINQSVHAQISDLKMPRKEENQKSCLVIGGNGQMGRWFVNFFKSSGFYVEVQDPNLEDKSNGHTILPDRLDHEIIAVCVPLRKMRSVVEEVIAKKPKGLVFEIASIKNELLDLVDNINKDGINLVSVHPMFGPDASNLQGKNFIMCTTKHLSEIAKNEFRDLFNDTLVNLVEIELEDHDKYMQYSLGLSHLSNLLYGAILSKSPIKYNELSQLGGTTFMNQTNNTIDIFNKNADLFHAIQNINPYRDELHNIIKNTLSELLEASEQDDGILFAKIVEQGMQYFEGEDN